MALKLSSSDIAVQDEINTLQIERLRGIMLERTGAPVAQLALLDELAQMGGEGKCPEFLQAAGELARALGGLRVTHCKSGKDRTGMSVTLEQARTVQGTLSRLSLVPKCSTAPARRPEPPACARAQDAFARSWGAAEVEEWVGTLGMSAESAKYFSQTLATRCVDGAALLGLTRSSLTTELGLSKLGPIKRALAGIAELQAAQEATDTTMDGAATVGPLLDTMRSFGVRRENVRLNVGNRDRYAFNMLQAQFLPSEYRPPSDSCGRVQT